MERKSPQQKKLLSYLRDGRNNYGENDKSSRRNIRRNKRAANSANRRREHMALAAFAGAAAAGEPGTDTIDRALHRHRPKRWKKSPDLPLGQDVIGLLECRVRKGIDTEERAQARIRRVRDRLGGADRS
ncbi:hypothetical protein PUR71_08280 [Streptomyces sp. SP17BM10]|uniref:hypothetical protein n=1 Tax=Streptomyces sp. SP17BM10 TaxID=3002530 RepID=UPI002E764524|nr:hypothetical protein [Streptomyces sp. SP17BM10]MEE1782912.1 hypothetical protein [Streptomyces sp. SP17BM10]